MSVTKGSNEKLKEYVKNLSDDDFSALQSIITNENYTRQKEREINSLIAHKEYVGKCYKYQLSDDLTLYRMIISPQGNNEYHVTAFQFYDEPKVKNKSPVWVKIYHEIEFQPFTTVSWGIFCGKSAFDSNKIPHFSYWTEISTAEFFHHMDAAYCGVKIDLAHNSFDVTDKEIAEARGINEN